MLLWDSVKSEFVWEGSWRDVVVLDVGIAEWRAAVKALADAGFQGTFSVDDAESDLPDDVELLFEQRGEISPLWSVSVVGVQLACHFFDESEIEFDLDPREVVGQPQIDGLVRFMQSLAAVTGRAALMTPENMHEVPFLRVNPSGEAEYMSSNGFFEELARGRG